MKEDYSFVNKTDYKIGFIQENIETFAYSALCFLIPFFIGHPQLLVGTIVNASLILGALNIKNLKLLPIIILPSLAVLSRGLIFGPFTIFLVYMIPFIWIGNSLLVYTFKQLNLNKKVNKWFTLAAGALIKTLFLFVSAFVLVNLKILPPPFLVAMGLFQFYTAIMGGILAISVQAIKKKVSA